jgi:histidinol-phosphate aminotransferase
MDRRDFLIDGAASSLSLAGIAPSLLPTALLDPSQNSNLRLNHNANPLGMPPSARKAILDSLADIPHYPDGPPRDRLIEQIAGAHLVSNDQVLLGQGSTEIIRAAVQAHASPGSRILQADPTYENAIRYAEPFPYRIEKIPLTSSFAHDVERMSNMAKKWIEPVVVYICNPNNPTGTLTASADLDAWFSSAPDNLFFIVDEAYYPLVDDSRYWSAEKWASARDNIVVCRTFSKLYGIAGLRVGYGLCSPKTAGRLQHYLNRSSPNTLAIAAASAALKDKDWHNASVKIWSECKKVVADCLNELGLHYFESHTAFLFHEILGDQDLYIRRMRDQGILVGRKFPPILSHNRLSLSSTPEGLIRFTDTLRKFRSKGWV